ncbi:hypothetical protein [Cryptosporangium aurantiacum]|uniref:hypothetical protein n=1 Tax=Cryptosporangium aurantiacum TaxID=134849 RepID=UPI00093338D5|nr:hypothetical protein [Cryptosporangium aurantiacum]
MNGASHWSDTESVLVRLGLVDPDGRPLGTSADADAPNGAVPDPATDGERPAVFPIGAVPHQITIAEPVPTFDALVARTRARARDDDEAPRRVLSGPFGPAPEPPGEPAEHPLAPRLARVLPGRLVQRLLPGRPPALEGVPTATDSPTPTGPGATGSVPGGAASPSGATAKGASGPVPVDIVTPRPIPSRSAPAPFEPPPSSEASGPRRRPRRGPTPAQWRSGGLIAAVVAVLLVVAVPAAVASWRSALAEAPSAAAALGGGLGVAGFVLFAVGVLTAARAGAGEDSARSLPALLARPGALPIVLGLALLFCAAIAVG